MLRDRTDKGNLATHVGRLFGTDTAEFGPIPHERQELLTRKRWLLAPFAVGISSRLPRPGHQPLGLQMFNERRGRHAASGRVEQCPAQLPGRQAIPGHSQRCKPPAWGAGHAARLLIVRLMTASAPQPDDTAVVGTALHVKQVSVLIVALPRIINGCVAVKAARMSQHRRHLHERLSRLRRTISIASLTEGLAWQK